jgi:hypothetical protein
MSLMRARAEIHYSVELIASDLSDGVLGYISMCYQSVSPHEVLTITSSRWRE